MATEDIPHGPLYGSRIPFRLIHTRRRRTAPKRERPLVRHFILIALILLFTLQLFYAAIFLIAAFYYGLIWKKRNSLLSQFEIRAIKTKVYRICTAFALLSLFIYIIEIATEAIPLDWTFLWILGSVAVFGWLGESAGGSVTKTRKTL